MSSVSAKVLFEYVAQQDDELTIQLGDIITNVQQEDGGWWRGEVNGKSGMFPENFVAIVKSSTPANPTSFKAEVCFDYEPEQGDEIALIKGSIIEVIDTPDEGWWKGRYNGKEGLFPSNFVEKIETPKPNPTPMHDNDQQKVPDKGTKPSQPTKAPSKIANLLGMIKPEDLSRNNLKKSKNGIDMKNENDGLNQADGIKPTQLVTPMHLENEKKMVTAPDSGSDAIASSSIQYAIAVYDYEPELPDELELKEGDRIKIIESELTFEGWMRGEINGKVGIFPDNFVELQPREELQNQAVATTKKREDPKPTMSQPPKEPPKKPKQAVMPPGVNILQDDKLKNELAGKLAKLSPGGPPPPMKVANKPPPPVPVNKPMLPSSKPKPQLPQSKPSQKLPFPPKFNNDTASPPVPLPKDEIRTPLKPDLKKPITAPMTDEKSSKAALPDESSEKKKIIPAIDCLSNNEPKNKEEDLMSIGRSASASIKEKPKFDSPARSRSFSGKDQDCESPNIESDEQKVDVMANNHAKISGKKSIQLDDIKPTNPLKHLERAKPPAKSPPSKYMEKHANEEQNISFDNGKEVDELKSKVKVLECKIEDMSDMFKKLVIQLTDDLSTERKLRSNLQIEVETLNKKLDIFLNKPGL